MSLPQTIPCPLCGLSAVLVSTGAAETDADGNFIGCATKYMCFNAAHERWFQSGPRAPTVVVEREVKLLWATVNRLSGVYGTTKRPIPPERAEAVTVARAAQFAGTATRDDVDWPLVRLVDRDDNDMPFIVPWTGGQRPEVAR